MFKKKDNYIQRCRYLNLSYELNIKGSFTIKTVSNEIMDNKTCKRRGLVYK